MIEETFEVTTIGERMSKASDLKTIEEFDPGSD